MGSRSLFLTRLAFFGGIGAYALIGCIATVAVSRGTAQAGALFATTVTYILWHDYGVKRFAAEVPSMRAPITRPQAILLTGGMSLPIVGWAISTSRYAWISVLGAGLVGLMVSIIRSRSKRGVLRQSMSVGEATVWVVVALCAGVGLASLGAAVVTLA